MRSASAPCCPQILQAAIPAAQALEQFKPHDGAGSGGAARRGAGALARGLLAYLRPGRAPASATLWLSFSVQSVRARFGSGTDAVAEAAAGGLRAAARSRRPEAGTPDASPARGAPRR